MRTKSFKGQQITSKNILEKRKESADPVGKFRRKPATIGYSQESSVHSEMKESLSESTIHNSNTEYKRRSNQADKRTRYLDQPGQERSYQPTPSQAFQEIHDNDD